VTFWSPIIYVTKGSHKESAGMEENEVFKALADPHRRTLLDSLFQQGGQSVGELCRILPSMTRYGVMKHLQILEDGGLVTSEKIGRERHYYLNPVPLQVIYERWVSKYAQPWAQTLTGLKSLLETPTMSDKHVLQIFIQTSPERLWQALTEGELTQLYYFGSRVESTWQVGSPYRYPRPEGGTFVEGEVLECDPPRRLVASFRALWHEAGAAQAPSQVTWQIEPQGQTCKLTLTHQPLNFNDPHTHDLIEGWARITSGLKTLLETGQPSPFSS